MTPLSCAFVSTHTFNDMFSSLNWLLRDLYNVLDGPVVLAC